MFPFRLQLCKGHAMKMVDDQLVERRLSGLSHKVFGFYLTYKRKVKLFIFVLILPDVYNYSCVWLQWGLL